MGTHWRWASLQSLCSTLLLNQSPQMMPKGLPRNSFRFTRNRRRIKNEGQSKQSDNSSSVQPIGLQRMASDQDGCAGDGFTRMKKPLILRGSAALIGVFRVICDPVYRMLFHEEPIKYDLRPFL